jgi:hypothetical protein
MALIFPILFILGLACSFYAFILLVLITEYIWPQKPEPLAPPKPRPPAITHD